jgi:hypothetical protein
VNEYPEPAGTSPAPSTEEIGARLHAYGLPHRNLQPHVRGMVTAVQPLTMGETEICTDTILAQYCTYPNHDILTRETETLTLKKAAFSDFEPSLTPIPKYCFVDKEASGCIMVHTVPRCTLEAILDWCENRYPHPYPCNRGLWYADWFHSIVNRIQSFNPTGGFRVLKNLLYLPKALVPPPPRIPQWERENLAAFLLHTVRRHHKKSIFHDCITEKTIFFTGPYQSLFLANYAGIPAPVLSDTLPPELLEPEAAEHFGPHFRDVYALACITCRILTGKLYDGRSFLLRSPRPTAVVLREIIRDNDLTFSLKSFADVKHTVTALYRTVRTVAGCLQRMFSPECFSLWRDLNRATGLAWRRVPLFGPFCDIYSPTVIAQALRYILDRHWVDVYRPPRSTVNDPNAGTGPSLSLLVSVFRVKRTITFPHFAEGFTALIHETDERRSAFGYVMEHHGVHRKWFRPLLRVQLVLPAIAGALLIPLLLVFLLRNRTPGETAMVQPTPATVATATTTSLPRESSVTLQKKSNVSTTPPVPAIPADSAQPSSAVSAVSSTVPDHTVEKPAAPVKAKLRTTTTARTVKHSVRHRKKPAPPPPSGTLNPALGFKDVFVVTEVRDSCNPGELAYPTGQGIAPVILGKVDPPLFKLYMVHRSSRGFSSIRTIGLCREHPCTVGRYYTTIGNRKAAMVRTGDAIGGNHSELQRFVQLRMSLINR